MRQAVRDETGAYSITDMMTALCECMAERKEALDLKGKRLDNELVAFMSGAASVLSILGDDKGARHIGRINAMLFAVRGYSEVAHLLAEKKAEKV